MSFSSKAHGQMTGSSLAIDIDKVRGARRELRSDVVAVEEPLEIQLCSATATGAAARSIAVTMRTPGDDIDLALGFLYTEQIIRGPADVVSTMLSGAPDPDSGLRNTIRVELDPALRIDTDRLTRHFYTTSSCGVCGKASIEALQVVIDRPDDDFRLTRDVLASMPARLRGAQQVFESTGGLHAAAAFDTRGEVVVVREDVGRHNAVDKVVGALLAAHRLPAGDLGLIVSGRASFELTQKALAAGMPLLAAVSAPSSLAVRLARDYGMTLVGFLRQDNFNIYSGANRLSI